LNDAEPLPVDLAPSRGPRLLQEKAFVDDRPALEKMALGRSQYHWLRTGHASRDHRHQVRHHGVHGPKFSSAVHRARIAAPLIRTFAVRVTVNRPPDSGRVEEVGPVSVLGDTESGRDGNSGRGLRGAAQAQAGLMGKAV
jgi:hypothetical protein